MPEYTPNFEEFKKLTTEYNLVPVYRVYLAQDGHKSTFHQIADKSYHEIQRIAGAKYFRLS